VVVTGKFASGNSELRGICRVLTQKFTLVVVHSFSSVSFWISVWS
jgi:hypothetical protein